VGPSRGSSSIVLIRGRKYLRGLFGTWCMRFSKGWGASTAGGRSIGISRAITSSSTTRAKSRSAISDTLSNSQKKRPAAEMSSAPQHGWHLNWSWKKTTTKALTFGLWASLSLNWSTANQSTSGWNRSKPCTWLSVRNPPKYKTYHPSSEPLWASACRKTQKKGLISKSCLIIHIWRNWERWRRKRNFLRKCF